MSSHVEFVMIFSSLLGTGGRAGLIRWIYSHIVLHLKMFHRC
jgi:hypothetical protein